MAGVRGAAGYGTWRASMASFGNARGGIASESLAGAAGFGTMGDGGAGAPFRFRGVSGSFARTVRVGSTGAVATGRCEGAGIGTGSVSRGATGSGRNTSAIRGLASAGDSRGNSASPRGTVGCRGGTADRLSIACAGGSPDQSAAGAAGCSMAGGATAAGFARRGSGAKTDGTTA